MRLSKRRNYQLVAAGACLGMALGAGSALQAQPTTDSSSNPSSVGDQLSKLEKENQDLKKRLDALENLAQKEGLTPTKTTTDADPPVSALTDFSITGFVTASYFHDTSEPSAANGHVIPGYLWNRINDSISLNKVKLTFASPPAVESGDKFDAAYRVSFIAGQDAPIVNSSASTIGFQYLREAYLEMNIPIGTGLNVRAGELISLLNYESGDGGAANNNFSQGFQWFFTGNGPSAGAQLGYDITDFLNVKLRIQNGLYAGPVDNNSSKTGLGSITVKPYTNTWVTLIGFGGREDSFAQTVMGCSLLADTRAILPQLDLGTEIDFFDFQNPNTVAAKGYCSVYSFGLFAAYDITKEFDLALRVEYLSDDKGADIVGNPVSANGTFQAGGPLGILTPPGTGQDITSVALTLNYKPISRIKIQPEIRYDYTSWSHGWDPDMATPNAYGKQNRFILGMGASYLF